MAKRKPAAAQRRLRQSAARRGAVGSGSGGEGEEVETTKHEEQQQQQQQQQQQELQQTVLNLVSSCSHVPGSVNVEAVEEALRRYSAWPCCSDCNKPRKEELWVCLACGHVGCAHSRAGMATRASSSAGAAAAAAALGVGHAVDHARKRHCLVHSFGADTCIWCFKCKGFIVRGCSVADGFGSGPKGHLLEKAAEVVQQTYRSQQAQSEEAGTGAAAADYLAQAISTGMEQQDTSGRNGSCVRGLMNLGNTCFFNSVMQNLLALRHLQRHFVGKASGNEGPLTSALRSFFQEIHTAPPVVEATKPRRRLREQGSSLNPKGLFGALCSKSPRFKGFQEQDSHELLRCLLDGLQVEEESEERQQTLVNQLFGGELVSTVTCCTCGHSSSVFEPFLDLSLPIPARSTRRERQAPARNSTKEQVSKRELKGKRLRKQRQHPVVSKSYNRKEASIPAQPTASASSAIDDDVGWLDFVGDDYVDVNSKDRSSDCTVLVEDAELLELTASSVRLEGGAEDVSAIATVTATSTPTAASTSSSTSTAEAAAGADEPTASRPTATDEEQAADGRGKSSEPDEASKSLEVTSAEVVVPEVAEKPSAESGWELVQEEEGLADLFAEPEEEGASSAVVSTVVQAHAGNEDASSDEADEMIVEETTEPMTLQGCLSAFTKSEVLSGDNAWDCSKCSKRQEDEERHRKGRDARKRLLIRKAPKVLTVHLKRFAHDIRGRLSKLAGYVAFDELLCLNQFQENRKEDEACVYRLVGVVEHSGTMRGGHYVAFVRARSSSGSSEADAYCWYYISDSDVRKSSLEQVLRREAYLLFYEREK